MTLLYYIVMVLHIAACLFLISVVLLQQGKGQDLASAFGGGGSQTAFGPRGSATVLSRATTILAGVFMVTSLTLSLVKPKEASLLDDIPQTAAPAAGAQEEAPAPAEGTPGAGVEPAPEKDASPEAAAPAEGADPTPEGGEASEAPQG
jgi:preprotein translocase subunit SecG